MDKGISIATALFILSMIAERIITWIKLYYGKVDRVLLGYKKKGIDLRKKTDDASGQTQREIKILGLNLVISIAIAIVAKADLFQIVSNDKISLGWKEQLKDVSSFAWTVIGCILTGLFISFGSKFWHDLLDLLLEIKNLKRSLSEKVSTDTRHVVEEKNTFNQANLDEMQTAFSEYKSKLIEIPAVSSVVLERQDSGYLLKVYLHDGMESDRLIPSKFIYQTSNGNTNSLPIQIIANSSFVAHTAFKCSDEIGNALPYPNNKGAAGCYVYSKEKKETYFLTCYHVAKSTEHKWVKFVKNGNEHIVSPFGSDNIIAMVDNAVLTAEIDAAILRVLNNGSNPEIAGIGTPFFHRRPTSVDRDNKTRVKMLRLNESEISYGYIADFDAPVELSYFDDDPQAPAKVFRLEHTIHVRSLDGSKFSDGGDSGSLVFDEYNYAIGILTGGNADLSFVVPIESIFSHFKIQFL